jgi:hypothetical protein
MHGQQNLKKAQENISVALPLEPSSSVFQDIIHAYIKDHQNTKERRVKFF